MVRYILRRLATLFLTMLVVSIVIFGIVEIVPVNVARNILGHFSTEEQERSMENQMGLDRPPLIRYISWLAGSNWQAERFIGQPLVSITEERGLKKDYLSWWVKDENENLVQWDVLEGQLYKLIRQPDGEINQIPDETSWLVNEDGNEIFWGVDSANRAVMWEKGTSDIEYLMSYGGWIKNTDSPADYIPITKGVLHGDFGMSLMYHEPVSKVLKSRLINSAILAAISFAFSIPTALILGVIAGMTEGSWLDRFLSLGGLVTTASPDFATGILLIIVFSLGLKILPGATVFETSKVLSNPSMLVLPVLTISLMEIGYILRITRVSVIDIKDSAFVRTAILKGLPYQQVIFRHVLRNALMAPVTVIMLHVNWLIGGLVVVESVFGYPGMGNFLLGAAQYKDLNAIEGGTLLMIVIAVGTQLLADIIYAWLNPQVRYSK